jgi:N-acetylneuraminate synthase
LPEGGVVVEIIAELGINHRGTPHIAKSLIDVAKAAGCDYVKFQKRDIDSVYTQEELAKPRKSPWGTTTRDQKQGLEFSYQDYVELDEYCQKRGIPWFLSCWDWHSVDLMSIFDMPFLKVPSALITNFEFLNVVRETTYPVIISTGMSTPKEIDNAIAYLGKQRIHCILACTSTYPTAPEEINAKYVLTLKQLYPWAKIGFSNHYPGLMAMQLAVAYGAEVLETHITLDRTMKGSDQSASIEPQGLHELRKRIDLIEKMRGDGIKKVYDSEIPILEKLRR